MAPGPYGFLPFMREKNRISQNGLTVLQAGDEVAAVSEGGSTKAPKNPDPGGEITALSFKNKRNRRTPQKGDRRFFMPQKRGYRLWSA